MSALAARRAAAAASTSSSPAPSSAVHKRDPNLSSSSRKSQVKRSRSANRQSISPSPSTDNDDVQDLAGQQSAINLPNKRRRAENSPPSRPRYFAQAQSQAQPSFNGGRANAARAFSPSQPVQSLDVSSDEEDGSGESVLDEDEQEDGEEEEEAVMEMEEGRVGWSELTTPAAPSTPGPSRARDRETGDAGRATSTFVPEEGVNLARLTEEELRQAGLGDITGPGVVISLAMDETLMIAGMYNLTPLQRRISLFSISLSPNSSTSSQPESHTVFAPTSHPIPVIEVGDTSATRSSITLNGLGSLRLPRSFLRDGSRAVFLIREHRCGLEGLRAGAVPGFKNIWPDEGIWGLRNVNPIIGSFPVPIYPYLTPPSWSHAVKALGPPDFGAGDSDMDISEAAEQPWIGLIKGPKRSGKSTFGRAVLNKLLGTHEKVAWLECDLGQGEFSCGGIVGLWIIDRPVLGPPFTHPLVPQRAHFLGTYTPLTCPDQYLSAIQHLLDYFKFEVQFPLLSSGSTEAGKIDSVVPLVINTQGWVKGLGEDLLRSIEQLAAPTHHFSFEADHTAPAMDIEAQGWTTSPPPFDHHSSQLAPDQYGNTLKTFRLEVAPISPLQARYIPADIRILSTITYFHSRLSDDSSKHTTWDFSAPLAAIPPYEVEVSPQGAIREIYLVGEGADGIIPDDLPLALGGSMVALIGNMSENAGKLDSTSIYVQGRPLPAEEDTITLGLAVVRGIQPTEQGYKSQLLSPLPPSILGRTTTLVRNGALELSLHGLLDWRALDEDKLLGVEWDRVPFIDRGVNSGVGGERRRIRRNIMRKGQ